MKNKVLSFSDLGFLYSLLSLAYQTKSELKREAPWSFGL